MRTKRIFGLRTSDARFALVRLSANHEIAPFPEGNYPLNDQVRFGSVPIEPKSKFGSLVRCIYEMHRTAEPMTHFSILHQNANSKATQPGEAGCVAAVVTDLRSYRAAPTHEPVCVRRYSSWIISGPELPGPSSMWASPMCPRDRCQSLQDGPAIHEIENRALGSLGLKLINRKGKDHNRTTIFISSVADNRSWDSSYASTGHFLSLPSVW